MTAQAYRGRTRTPGPIDPKAQSYSPANYASLKWWLRGDSLDALANGQDVALWQDESGQNHNVIQHVGINTPVLTKNGLNGRHGVTFVNDLLYAASAMDLGTSLTLFFVFNNTDAHFGGLWDTAPGQGNVFRNKTEAGVGIIDWWNLEPSVAMGLSAGNNLICVQTYMTSGDTIRNIKYWRNAAYVGLTTFSNSSPITWFPSPGIGAYNTNAEYFVGTIYETAWFSEVLTEGDRLDVENYLRGRYAL